MNSPTPSLSLKYLYPEQRKQYLAIVAFIAILFIIGSILVISKFADLGQNSNKGHSVQGISTQSQDLNQFIDQKKASK